MYESHWGMSRGCEVGKWIVGYGACVLVALSAYADPSSMDDFRIFTAADGRVIEAKIIACESARGKVQIERNNRKKVWVQADIFSEEDQTYIQEWITVDQFLSNSKLRISVEKQKGKKVSNGTPIHYELTLDNRSGISFDNVEVDYRIMVEEQGFSGHKDSERCVAGKIKLETLPSGKSIKKKTGSELLIQRYTTQTEITHYSDGSSDIDTSKNKVRQDKVAGIWLKIKSPKVGGVAVVRDFCYPADLSKKFDWVEYGQSHSTEVKVSSSKRASNSKVKKILKEAEKYKAGDGVKKDPKKALELFKEAYALESSAAIAMDIGALYLYNGDVRDFALAEQWMDAAAKKGSSYGYNQMALFFSSGKPPQFRDGKKAVRFALKVREIEGEEGWLLDTLACAYARDGQFSLAIETQEKAYQLARRDGTSKEGLKGYTERLALFKQGKAWPAD
jgi:hypothetical protein